MMNSKFSSPLMITVQVNQAKLQMEVDTGASASIISYDTFMEGWPALQRPQLHQSPKKLRTYTGEELMVEGQLMVEVVYGDQRKELPLLVVAGRDPSLMGRDWLLHIRLDWQSIHSLEAASITSLQTVLSNHTAVFADELGCVKGVKAKIYVDPEAKPFCKPRAVPFAFREKVNKELERLEKTGVIEPVQHADWAALIFRY